MNHLVHDNKQHYRKVLLNSFYLLYLQSSMAFRHFMFSALSSDQRLLQWRNGEKTVKRERQRGNKKSGFARDDEKRRKETKETALLISSSLSPRAFVSLPSVPRPLFPLSPFPSLSERRKRPLRRRECSQSKYFG